LLLLHPIIFCSFYSVHDQHNAGSVYPVAMQVTPLIKEKDLKRTGSTYPSVRSIHPEIYFRNLVIVNISICFMVLIENLLAEGISIPLISDLSDLLQSRLKGSR
jgi:hypothetical protein